MPKHDKLASVNTKNIHQSTTMKEQTPQTLLFGTEPNSASTVAKQQHQGLLKTQSELLVEKTPLSAKDGFIDSNELATLPNQRQE